MFILKWKDYLLKSSPGFFSLWMWRRQTGSVYDSIIAENTLLPSSPTTRLSLDCSKCLNSFLFKKNTRRKQATVFCTTPSSVPHFFHCSFACNRACGTQGTARNPDDPETSLGDAHLPASSTPRPQSQHLPLTTSAVEKTLNISQLQTWSNRNKPGIADGPSCGFRALSQRLTLPRANHG